LRKDIFDQLAVLENEILSVLKSNDPTQWALLARRRLEVKRLMNQEIDPLIEERYQHIAVLLDVALLRFARHEAEATERIVNSAAQQEIVEEPPSDRQLRAGVVAGLFPSATQPTDASAIASEWWTRAGASLSQRVGDTLTVGVALEENLVELTRRIRGSSDMGFRDGVLERGREAANRLLTTQVTHAVTETRMAVGDRNPQQLMAVHQSILDSKTSYVCLGRHGLRYTFPEHEPLNHDIPYLSGPPYHPNCRSVMILALRDGGPILQESASAWLRRQGPAVQDEVLGPTRARMFRNGSLSSTRQLIDAATGRLLRIEELEN